MMISEVLAKELISVAEENGLIMNITNPNNTYDMNYRVIAVEDIKKCYELLLCRKTKGDE